MKKKYIAPSIKARIIYPQQILSGSIDLGIGSGTQPGSNESKGIFDGFEDGESEEEGNIFDEE